MANAGSVLLFLVFAAAQIVMYLGIRRQWFSPSGLAAVGVATSFAALLLFALAQGNSIYQAIFTGLFAGIGISAITLAMALFFQRSSERQRDFHEEQHTISPPIVPDMGTPLSESGDERQQN
jgi:Na+/H+-translocating membrane pyrophosphatase